MRWLTLPEVAEHLLGENPSTLRNRRQELDGVVTKRVGRQVRYHPEAAWFFACHGRPATTLEEAYAWADVRPLPAIEDRGARLVRSGS